jgi:hypothetical protein
MPDSNRIPTVSRVSSDTLVELVYNAAKHTTALAVSRFDGLWNIEQEVSIGTGELLVPYSPANNLITSGCVLLPSMPLEYGLKDELVADIRAFLHRYVDLSPLFEQIAVHYVLLSWVHDAFGELPYLRLRGDYGTGKTRALHTIGSLCYRPFFASGASTVSPIVHTLDSFGGTLVLDEADLPYSDAKADLVKILNNGTAKGMPVLRTIQNRYKEFNPYAFKVYGPKLIATREPFQDIALESRFFTEETYSRSLRPDIPIHLPASMKDEALALRNRLLHFRFSEFFHIKTDPAAIIEGVESRANQSALALLSLVEDPALRAEIQSWLKDKSADLARTRREAPDACVLAAVIATFAEHAGGPAPVALVTKRFNADNADRFGPMSYRGIGAVLRGRLNLETKKTGGVFVVPATERAKLQALSHRYAIRDV